MSFLGVLMLGPVLVPACVRLLGRPAGLLGTPGRLASSNALRNPRRTAATTASLLVGVTLVSGLAVGMATVRSAVDGELDRDYPLDLALSSSTGPLRPDALERVRGLPEVAQAVALPGAGVTLRSGGDAVATLSVLGADAGTSDVLRAPAAFGSPRPGQVFLPWKAIDDAGLVEGDRVSVVGPAGRAVLAVRGSEGVGAEGVVAASVLDRLTGPPAATRAVWIRATPDADAADLRSAVTSIGWASGATVHGGLDNRAFVDLQIDLMTGAVVALLAIGIAIALVGIGSTLGLSVLERTREHSVLRALGLTRRQLRGTLAVEALLLATVAGVLGMLLGAGYAWVGVTAVRRRPRRGLRGAPLRPARPAGRGHRARRPARLRPARPPGRPGGPRRRPDRRLTGPGETLGP